MDTPILEELMQHILSEIQNDVAQEERENIEIKDDCKAIEKLHLTIREKLPSSHSDLIDRYEEKKDALNWKFEDITRKHTILYFIQLFKELGMFA